MIEHDKKTAGVANHFVSMGFITNQCENQKLNSMSHEVGRERRDGKNGKNGKGKTSLVAAVVVLSVIVFAICTYCILKKRGQICKKKLAQDVQTIEHVPHVVS